MTVNPKLPQTAAKLLKQLSLGVFLEEALGKEIWPGPDTTSALFCYLGLAALKKELNELRSGMSEMTCRWEPRARFKGGVLFMDGSGRTCEVREDVALLLANGEQISAELVDLGVDLELNLGDGDAVRLPKSLFNQLCAGKVEL